MIARIQARRDALVAQLAEGQQQYAQLEKLLIDLDRQLCAMQGGIQELDVLLTPDALLDVTDTVETRTAAALQSSE